ncbi:MAG TPA: hypothetical protein VN924_30035 [Bryobacteraceae bacterium]|nr:hypothetical protein [Bryobacteraceae bacterium]
MRTIVKVLPSALAFAGLMLAQGAINTYAGNDALFAGAGKAATAAQIVGPNGMAVDAQGNLYISASGLSMVLKVAANTGVVSIYAGNGLSTGGGDGGLAVGAALDYPAGLAFDAAGNLYIVDAYASNVRKVAPNGIITTVAGDQGAGGFAGDGGPATKALLTNPSGIAVDKSGNLYIADTGNNRIRMVAASSGIISTIAGSSTTGLTGDGGPAVNATFTLPGGLAIDASGNLYIADQNNWVIRRISGGIITTVAGTGKPGYSGDNGQATKAMLGGPQGVAVDASGNLYIADTGNQRIRYVNVSGAITTIAGTGVNGFSGDGGAATAATFSTPVEVAVDASGNVYVADLYNNRIRRFVPGGAIATFAGTTTFNGDGGPSTQASVEPWSVAVDSSDNLYIADRLEQRVRKVTPSGTITTLAGTGQAGGGGDNGPGNLAALNTPNGVAVDSAGNVYIADAGNMAIRRVDAATGIITAFAGTGNCCYAGTGTGGDGGPATAATLYYPESVAVDGLGNVYFTDLVQSNISPLAQAVRRVTTDGKIDTWAGGGPTVGFSGDGGSPLQAQFGSSITLAAGSDGSLYIADANNNRVRKVDPAGATINTVAGNGQNSTSGNGGQATSAGVGNPLSAALDKAGNLYIGFIGAVRVVTPAGVIGPYAGSGYGFSGDGGPATAAWLTGASGLAVDSASNLYISDSGNRRVRQVQPAASPVMALSPTYVTFSLAATGSTSTNQSFVLSNSGQGALNWASSVSTTAGGTWLSVSPSTGSILAGQAGTTVTVTANPSGLTASDYYGQIQITSPNAASPVQSVTVRLTVQTAGENPPQAAAGGVLNAASFSLSTPVAPGAMVSIFGTNFTDSTSALTAQGFPLPTQMGGTSVTIGGEPVPLLAVTATQINAVLPFDLTVNSSLPIVVIRNNAVSAPQPVSMVSSLPGVFTQSENGEGVGIVVIVHPDGSQVEAGNGNAATAGDAVVIYCAGLGDVSPRAIAGSPAPPSPLSNTIDPVTVTIGGVNAPVFFAGLTPGFTGLYQVNATVPTGIAPNQQAPMVLSQGGRASATVTIPVQ